MRYELKKLVIVLDIAVLAIFISRLFVGHNISTLSSFIAGWAFGSLLHNLLEKAKEYEQEEG